MIKRLKYISRQSRDLTREELARIARVSQTNNAESGVTGVLVLVGDYFFQVLEGPADAVDATLTRIEADDRHQDIILVGKPESVPHRLFGEWAMRVEIMEPGANESLEPLGAILDTIVALRSRSNELTAVLQRAVLRELRQVEPGVG